MSLEPIMTLSQVATYLQVTERTVYEWLRSGDLRGYKVGRLWRIKERDVLEFVFGTGEIINGA